MVFFKINNKTISSPKEISHSYEILDKTERTLNGTLVVDIIGKKKQIDVTWEYLSKEDMTILTEEVNTNTFQDIEYIDPETGEATTMVGRLKDFTYSPGYDWVNTKVRWNNVTVSFVEK